ncbi:cell division FtsZ-interacting protein ZapD [Paenibacillus anaericanus]|nr:cell division FtsZ-interacting protein ZapD [Paenibacillus anaericanus]
MKNKLFIFIGIMIVIIGSIFVYSNFSENVTIRTVSTLIEKVDRGNIKGELSNEQVNSIKEMFAFSDHNELDKPRIDIRRTYKNKDEEQLIATFEVFQYSNNNQLENIYVGHLSFTLVKKSIFKWEVVDVKTISTMKKQL